MRRVSFAATVEAMRSRTKTVTRRSPATWAGLRPGDRVLAVEATRVRKGERQVVLGVIEITSVRVEPLALAAVPGEAEAEGFADLAEFEAAWRRLHGCWDSDHLVRRIEFTHARPGPGRDPQTGRPR